jgi:hypothetical protein
MVPALLGNAWSTKQKTKRTSYANIWTGSPCSQRYTRSKGTIFYRIMLKEVRRVLSTAEIER